MCDTVKFDIGGFENKSYNRYSAQSMTVKSQYKQPKSLDYQQMESRNRDVTDNNGQESRKNIFTTRSSTPEIQEVKLRRNGRTMLDDSRRYSCSNITSTKRSSLCASRSTEMSPEDILNQSRMKTLQWQLNQNSRTMLDDTRRYSCSNITSTKRSSLCANRTTEMSPENIPNQSKIEMLQWQLKQIKTSREMYRAAMKQVVTYLEKAHHSLELLGTRMNKRTGEVQRSKSEHQMDHSCGLDNGNMSQSTNGPSTTLDEHQMRDKQWKQGKPEEADPEEVPPEKLASEAHRLWRTVQSLLSTQEPDFASPENEEFIAQLAKEFPAQPEDRPQRATSFSLVTAPNAKISTAFSRKLSLQLGDSRRMSKVFRNVDSARCSVAGSDSESLRGQKTKLEKPNSPASGSESSVEDESGFSSMTSFQEVGLPLVNSTMTEQVSTRTALLRSMLHNNGSHSIPNPPAGRPTDDSATKRQPHEEVRPPASGLTARHQRWFSSPADQPATSQAKVLWV